MKNNKRVEQMTEGFGLIIYEVKDNRFTLRFKACKDGVKLSKDMFIKQTQRLHEIAQKIVKESGQLTSTLNATIHTMWAFKTHSVTIHNDMKKQDYPTLSIGFFKDNK